MTKLIHLGFVVTGRLTHLLCRFVKLKTRSCAGEDLNDLQREIAIFHELGHAILKRQHTNETLPNGDFKSIMFPTPYDLYTLYTPEKRKYYLDELFYPFAATPIWAEAKTTSTEIFSDSISSASNSWTFHRGPEDDSGLLTDSIFASPKNSLSIISKISNDEEKYSYWSYRIDPAHIAVRSQIKLNAKIKLSQVAGTPGGVILVLRGDTNGTTNFYKSTSLLNGTQDFVDYQISINYFPEKVTDVYIEFIMFSNTTGKAYLDDIFLINNQ